MDADQLRVFCEKVVTNIARGHGFVDPRVDLSAGSEKGDNFLGQLTRCVVTEKNNSKKQMHLMVKVPAKHEKIRFETFFTREKVMYGLVLPALAECYKKKGLLGKNDVFPGTARAFVDVSSKDESLIVMEDLRNRGFVMRDRIVGLDVEHCRSVLRQLACLHAASLALQRDNPELHEELVQQMPEMLFRTKLVSPDYLKSLNTVRRIIEERFTEGTQEREKFTKFADSITDQNLTAYVTRNDTFCAINHGDLWTNNIMFKYKEGSTVPEDACFVDLQISRYASPCVDISYFLCLCTRKETRRHHDDLIKSYYDSLAKHLADLGHDSETVIPWEVFLGELRKYSGYGLGMAVRVVPVTIMDGLGFRGLDENVISENVATNFDLVKSILIDIVEDYVKFGYL